MIDNLDIIQRIKLIEASLAYLITLVVGVILIIVSVIIFITAKEFLGSLIAAGMVIMIWPLLGRALLKPTRKQLGIS